MTVRYRHGTIIKFCIKYTLEDIVRDDDRLAKINS